jgi:gluconate 2-dehydrogenase gamma chain
MASHDENPLRQLPLTRRNFLQTVSLAVAGTAAPAALPAQGIAGAQPSVSTETPARKIFSESQWKTVSVLCDLILPADERSGSATQASVPEFIDDWIDFRRQQDGDDSLLAQICGGLMWLDLESQRLFAILFAEAKQEQQRQILDRIAWPDHAAAEDHRWMRFFAEFRRLTVSGFYSSKMGVADIPYLGNTVVERWIGCPEPVWQTIQERRRTGYPGIRLQPPAKTQS